MRFPKCVRRENRGRDRGRLRSVGRLRNVWGTKSKRRAKHPSICGTSRVARGAQDWGGHAGMAEGRVRAHGKPFASGYDELSE